MIYYIVRVHFSTTSKETFTDKVNRLLRQEIYREFLLQERVALVFLVGENTFHYYTIQSDFKELQDKVWRV